MGKTENYLSLFSADNFRLEKIWVMNILRSSNCKIILRKIQLCAVVNGKTKAVGKNTEQDNLVAQ